jgi:tetratricopeptide (TPR) repeat protein
MISRVSTISRRDTAIRATGLVLSTAGAGLLAWLLAVQPATMTDLGGGLAASVGLYRIDQAAFDEGLRFFREDKFREARLAFERADPAARDATTQFYVAYSCYRQGWGRVYNDDALFREALEALDRAVAAAPGGRVIVDDQALGLRSSDELRAELERGLTRELSDLDPRRLLRPRQ